MTDIITRFRHAAAEATFWATRWQDSRTPAAYRALSVSGHTVDAFTLAELMVINQDWPAVMEHLEMISRTTSYRINANAVRYTLDMNETPCIAVPASACVGDNGNFVLSGPSLAEATLSPGQVTAEEIYICGMRYELTAANASVNYAVGASYARLRIKTSWLDETYPGWSERYHLAHAIGLEGSALSNHLFWPESPVCTEGAALPGTLCQPG